jgi:spermidine synthase
VLVPAIGLVRTLGLLAVCAAAVGAFAVLRGSGVCARLRWTVFAVGLAVLVGAVLTPADRLARLLALTRGGELVFYEESRGGTVAVVQQQNENNVFRRLYIQGVSNSGDAMPSLRYMRLQALLPLMIHKGEPRSALVIGFGTGITTGALLRYPKLEKRVCAELLPAVVRSGAMFPENYDAAHDPRVQIRMRDGRQELLRSSEKYDLITLEPPPPSAAGVVNLYSKDFYALAGARLEENGLLAQWLPLATQNDEDTREMVRSFLDVFPYASLWTTELHEMLLVGSFQPMVLDAREIETRYADAGVTTTLSAVGVSSPAALLATYVTGRDGLERYAGDTMPVTDDRPRIEYAAWVRPKEITRVLPKLLALRADPVLVNADDGLRAQVSAERKNLFAFYSAGLAAYNGDRDLWSATIENVMKQDGGNRYYQWMTGGAR